MSFYKYKYIKYKYKYLELKQSDVLSVISKNNFDTTFLIDFNFASQLNFIPKKNKINDALAIQLINDYNDYIDELEENQTIKQNSTNTYDGTGRSYEIVNLDGIGNDSYNYSNDEEDDPSDILKQIDMNTWKPLNSLQNQYYLFKLNEGYIDLNNYLNLQDEDIQINDFLTILNGICVCFIQILRCGLKPCFKDNSIMILPNEDNDISVLYTDTDILLSCKDDIEEETVRKIVKFINIESIPRNIKESHNFKMIFNLMNDLLSLKNKNVTVKGLKELIEKLLK